MTKEQVVAAVDEQDVKFIRLWFTDILGQLKSFAITKEELDEALRAGDGLRRLVDHRLQRDRGVGHDRDARSRPPSALLPYRPQEQAVARMFCDMQVPGGDPYEGDPRYVLRRALERARALGFDHYFLGPELEFFYFKDANGTETLDRGGYFDLTTLDAASDVRRETVLALEAMGIEVEYSTTRSVRRSTRSTCASPTRCRWPTT